LDRLTEILKERHDTGAHGDTFISMSSGTFNAQPKRKQDPIDVLIGSDLSGLFGIPVVINDDLSFGTWKLINITTKNVIEMGTWLDRITTQ
jgi:hypothetical protein